MSKKSPQRWWMIIGLIPSLLYGAAPVFDEALINKLPPSVAEWHSKEGMTFCAEAERAGLSWAQAHKVFTGKKLRAAQVSQTRLLIFSGDRQVGSVQLINKDDPGVPQLKILTDPLDGSFSSVRIIPYPGTDKNFKAFGERSPLSFIIEGESPRIWQMVH